MIYIDTSIVCSAAESSYVLHIVGQSIEDRTYRETPHAFILASALCDEPVVGGIPILVRKEDLIYSGVCKECLKRWESLYA